MLTVVELYVFSVSDKEEKYLMGICRKFREAGIKTDMDYESKNIKKNLKRANALEIPFCLMVGEDEIKQGKVTLKQMDIGEQKTCTIEEAIKILKLYIKYNR
jgi:histidyl-tRNA synthetase